MKEFLITIFSFCLVVVYSQQTTNDLTLKSLPTLAEKALQDIDSSQNEEKENITKDSSLNNFNFINFSSGIGSFKKIDKVLSPSFIYSCELNYTRYFNPKKSRILFIESGLSYQNHDVNVANIFRELSTDEVNGFPNSISDDVLVKFKYLGLNIGLGLQYKFRKISYELFEKAIILQAVSNNAENFSFSKEYGCTGPGVPSHCFSQNNNILFNKTYTQFVSGVRIKYNVLQNNYIYLELQSNTLSWLLNSLFIKRLWQGYSFKQINSLRVSESIYSGGGITIRYFPNAFMLNFINLGYTIKI
ncbi:MAG: hypothetical protein IM600_10190 [Bacteroidetes bacterium]|nr:hypothetical protein [Bacteroidota bacterium]MCA6443785.1 hypothetical protein [Bacteroidota bacterium]